MLGFQFLVIEQHHTNVAIEQDWRTEQYKGMLVHVCAVPHDAAHTSWDYSVRITQPGDDSGTESELTAGSGDDADYPTKQAAVEAGFIKGYSIVDAM